MSPSIVEALEKVQSLRAEEPKSGTTANPPNEEAVSEVEVEDTADDVADGVAEGKRKDNGGNRHLKHSSAQQVIEEPSLLDPRAGNPISHGQVIDLWKDLKARNFSPNSLDALLRGARIYIPPPRPKAEPTTEYKALMARLRREEEARSYERMINPPPPAETFAQRFPMSSAAHAFASSQQPINSSDPESDDVTYADIDRQMALIFNVLISIVACAAAIWMAAKWWSTPARLALSFSGSLLVGVAEVVVYSGYIRRVGDAKGKEKSIKEVKEIVNTWVVGGGEGDEPVPIVLKEEPDPVKARKRK